MMPFTEKLAFLMRISEVSSKELAAALGVDPSMVSLLRTGKRKLPKNKELSGKMGAFFASRCSAPYQRQALSEVLNQISIGPGMPAEVLASTLTDWLQGQSGTLTDSFLSVMGTPAAPVPDIPEPSATPAQVIADGKSTRFFFGPEGRREVMLLVMQACRDMEAPGTIQTVVDDNLEWLLSEYATSKKVQAGLLELLDRGFTIQQVVPPMNYINRYAESLQFWLPLYATGKATAFYYPRLRGNLYRHSIIVVPGCCVQYAAAVGLGSTSEITMFSTDPRLIETFERQFQEHVRLCRPALSVYEGHWEIFPRFREFFACEGSSIQLVNSLSVQSMPAELLERFIAESTQDVASETFKTFLANLPHFQERLSQEIYIDMCPLATPEEILSGTVPVASGEIAACGQPCYTAETYCIHLRNILSLLEQYENYYFLPLSKKEYPDFDLLVSEDSMAMLVRTTEPLITLVIRRQALVTAFQEHLLRRADAVGYNGIHKERVRMELRGLIQRLSSAASEASAQN